MVVELVLADLGGGNRIKFPKLAPKKENQLEIRERVFSTVFAVLLK